MSDATNKANAAGAAKTNTAGAAKAAKATSATSAADRASMILGTAGHIDHGKSSLILALTGTDCDRLPEEKRRGVTIELGFAQLTLPSGRAMGVVDVPGHERFVRQMVSGATGMDIALLVIAADDGIMPQTVEHLAVLQLLGIKSCVVALTKIDLVDEEWVEFATDEIMARLQHTPYADAPIVPVSSRTGEGLDELRAALDKAADNATRNKLENAARMPIDRVFTIKGHGTVVTGTLWSGSVSVGDSLEVLPQGVTTRVRSIQMHDKPYDQVFAGNRVALNLNALSTEDVRPGNFLSAPGATKASDRFDARFLYLDPFGTGKPLASGTRVHIAHGTQEVLGRILFMNGAPELKSGESTLAQIRLEEPLPIAYQDRFIVRSYSPVRVIGGGAILSANPRRRTNLKEADEALLDALEQANPQATVDAYLALATAPQTPAQISEAVGLGAELTDKCLQKALGGKAVMSLGAKGKYIARRSTVQKLRAQMEKALIQFHNQNPNQVGIAKEALRNQVAPTLTQEVFDAIAATSNAIVSAGGQMSHATAGAGAILKDKAAAEKLQKVYDAADGAAPTFPAACESAGVEQGMARRALAALEKDGAVVRYAPECWISGKTHARYIQAITEFLQANGQATAAQLKEAMGTSRKYAMPLLEHFDEIGLTTRDGDFRTLR